MKRKVKNLTTPEAAGIKSLKDSPEFEELCKKITHIDRISSSKGKASIFAEPDNSYRRRRRESSTAIGGE